MSGQQLLKRFSLVLILFIQIDATIRPGLINLTWSSMNMDSYFESVRNALIDFDALITQVILNYLYFIIIKSVTYFAVIYYIKYYTVCQQDVLIVQPLIKIYIHIQQCLYFVLRFVVYIHMWNRHVLSTSLYLLLLRFHIPYFFQIWLIDSCLQSRTVAQMNYWMRSAICNYVHFLLMSHGQSKRFWQTQRLVFS